MPRFATALAGELIGTFLIVLVGTGAVAAAVLTEALPDLWQVASVWAIGVTIAIYVARPLSGAHLNPAVSLALALHRPSAFPGHRLLAYSAFQLVGAAFAGILVLVAFGNALATFELREGLIRGEPGSERAAMIFGQYFPNPAMFGTGPRAAEVIAPWQALAIEALATGVLVTVIFVVSDVRNPKRPAPWLLPPIVGFTIGVLILAFAPLTQAGLNPARDLGPRLVALMAGFGGVALPGPRSGFWVYLLGPLLGAVLAGLLYERALGPLLRRESLEGRNMRDG